jgi:phenylalanyl-tRNA synthetase beta chain
MGVKLSEETVNDILSRMNFEYTLVDGMYHVVVPSRRSDYQNNYQDLIEDIARFYGFDNIPLTIPATSDKGHLTKEQSLERSIKNLLAGMGMNEAICYSLTSDEHLYEFVNEEKEAVKVLMPFTEEKEYMRQSLIPSLLEVVSYNKARKIDSAKFFEISSVYYEGGSHRLLSAAFSGIYEKSLWQQKVEKVDFFLVKGIVEELLSKIGITATYEASSKKNMHPGKCASIKVGSTEIGYLGAIHPKYQKEHSLNETFVFELNYELLLSLSEEKIKYTPVSKYPSITRDLAIVCNKDINASEIAALIKQTGKKILVDVSLFDLYVDESIGLENKQLAYKLTFCDSEKTLESQDVEKVIKSILNRLEFTYQAKLRQ